MAQANSGPRYPKRKRQDIKYYGSEDEEDVGPAVEDQMEPDSGDDEPAYKKKKPNIKTSLKAKKPPKNKIFPFMSLPAELRNKIYEYALTDPKGHYIAAEKRMHRRVGHRVVLNALKLAHPNKYERHRRHRQLFPFGRDETEETREGWNKRGLAPVLLRLNRAIREEAIGFLYSRPFIFVDTYALHDFLVQIGPRMRPLLREIEVAEWGYTSAHKAMNYPAMSLLGDAVNLERIWLNICHWENTLAAKVYRDCSAFFIAWGMAKGRIDAAVDIIELPTSKDEQRPWQAHKCTRSPEKVAKVLEDVRGYVKGA